MIQLLKGTLEGNGPNKTRTPSGSVRELGFDAMRDNASLQTVAPRGTVGSRGNVVESLANAIDPMGETDSTIIPMDESGTCGVTGPYG